LPKLSEKLLYVKFSEGEKSTCCRSEMKMARCGICDLKAMFP